MEDLILDTRSKTKYTPSVSEIQNMVKDILSQEEQIKQKENQPEMTTMAKPKVKTNAEIDPLPGKESRNRSY